MHRLCKGQKQITASSVTAVVPGSFKLGNWGGPGVKGFVRHSAVACGVDSRLLPDLLLVKLNPPESAALSLSLRVWLSMTHRFEEL